MTGPSLVGVEGIAQLVRVLKSLWPPQSYPRVAHPDQDEALGGRVYHPAGKGALAAQSPLFLQHVAHHGWKTLRQGQGVHLLLCRGSQRSQPMGQGNLQLFDVVGGGHLFPQPGQQGFAHPSRRQITEEGLADPVT
jgi:hypothetical protein